jgi:hypothetical protein
MSTERAMHEALQAAVTRMNGGASGGANGAEVPTDPIGLLTSVLPKLLGGGDDPEREDVVAMLESVKREELGTLRDQVGLLRKQLDRVLRVQEQTRAQLRSMEQLQLDTTRAVLELARQLARGAAEDAADGGAEPPRPPPARRSGAGPEPARARGRTARGGEEP